MVDSSTRSSVLFIKPSGPSDVRASKEIETLSDAGFEISFVGWNRCDDTATQDSQITSVRMLWLPVGFANWKVAPGYFVWMVYVFWHVLVTDADIIHAVDFESAWPAALANAVKKLPLVYDIYDLFHLRHNYPSVLRLILRRSHLQVMSQSDLIIRVDDRRISEAERRFTDKTIIVYNTPPDISEGGVDVPNQDNGPLVLALAGLLKRDRGVNWLLESVNGQDEVELLAIGPVRTAGLRDAICLETNARYYPPMPQEEALHSCKHADVIVAVYDPSTPLHRMASPNKLFDAMMLSKPVLVNEELEIAEFVKAKGIGYTVPYGNVHAIRDLLDYIRTHPEDARRRGERGRELYEQHYTWGRMEKTLLESYRLLSA